MRGASMVKVHRLQALLASHDAPHTVSTMSQIAHWIHWPEGPAAFVIAMIISYLSLLLGFHHKGRPFGSGKAITRSVMLIAVTALIAAVLSVLVPHLPLSLGIFIPALLCGAVLKENEAIEELRLASPELAAFVTIGISYFLAQARDQMSNDRAGWCDSQVNQFRARAPGGSEDELASLNSFSVAADRLRNGLSDRLPEEHRVMIQAEDHYNVVDPAIGEARQARAGGDTLLFRKKYNEAEQALKCLLRIAYDWKYDNIIDRAVVTNPPPRFTVSSTGLVRTDDDHLCLPIIVSAHLPDRPETAADRAQDGPGSSGVISAGMGMGMGMGVRYPLGSRRESSLFGTSCTSRWASSATHTAARVRRVRFSSPDRICETRPGETPIARARSALFTCWSFMRHVMAVVTSRGSRASSRASF
jgi:hypothetical protein